MDFIPVHIESDEVFNLCMQFRRDAHVISFGSDLSFSADETKAWFEYLSTSDDCGFYHVCKNDEIIGQIEFRTGLLDEQGNKFGYINLLYLLPELRNNGFGRKLEQFILAWFDDKQCTYAQLRYSPTNLQALSFYRKHGWSDVGEPSDRGQLAEKQLT